MEEIFKYHIKGKGLRVRVVLHHLKQAWKNTVTTVTNNIVTITLIIYGNITHVHQDWLIYLTVGVLGLWLLFYL